MHRQVEAQLHHAGRRGRIHARRHHGHRRLALRHASPASAAPARIISGYLSGKKFSFTINISDRRLTDRRHFQRHLRRHQPERRHQRFEWATTSISPARSPARSQPRQRAGKRTGRRSMNRSRATRFSIIAAALFLLSPVPREVPLRPLAAAPPDARAGHPDPERHDPHRLARHHRARLDPY